MRRREFIAFVGGAAIALPRGGWAQQPIPVIVFFNSGAPSTNVKNVAAFRNGLKEAGLVEGKNLAIEFVWAENRFDGLETLAAEVIARRPSVIISNTLARTRPKSSTTTIPIVFTTGSDPIRLAASGLICFANSSRRRALLPCWSILAPPRPTVSERRSKRQRKRVAGGC